MTKTQWPTSNDADLMIDVLNLCGVVSERKLRLFLVACARAIWDQLPNGPLREAVECAERLADGAASEDERLYFVDAVREIPINYSKERGENWFQVQDQFLVAVYFSSQLTVGNYRGCGGAVTSRIGWVHSKPATGNIRPQLIREIFGTPFDQLDTGFDGAPSSAVALAQHIYDQKCFNLMPQLAEHLQTAGWGDDTVYEHCREGGHVRGCWVVDLLLDKG